MFSDHSPTAIPRAIKVLILVNIVIYILDQLSRGVISNFLWFSTSDFLQGQIWRVGTYMFVHSQDNIFHILFNMLILWMFGVSVLPVMGEKRFLNLYLFAGIFAGLCSFIFDLATKQMIPYVGASGAVFAICVAFARYFPTRQIFLFFIFPVQAKWAVLIFISIDLALITKSDGIAHITHLGGALFALIYFKYEKVWENWFFIRQNRKEQKAFKKAQKTRQALIDIDPILEKISKQGMNSLSKSEKAALKKASQLKKDQKSNIIKLDDYRKRRQ